MKKVVHEEVPREGLRSTLDELAREGARRMIAAALEVEVDEYVRRFADDRYDDGLAKVVRNGSGKERGITMGAGTVRLKAPRVNDKREVDGERQRFTSKILPPYLRRSKNVSDVLPILYLRGLSTGDSARFFPRCLVTMRLACHRARSRVSSMFGRRSMQAGGSARSKSATTSTSGSTACTSACGSKKIGSPRS